MSARRIVTVDARSLRFAAALTTVVLAIAIVLGPPIGLLLLAAQTLVFAFGAVLGVRFQPYAALYHILLADRAKRPVVMEPEQPARFAQALGMLMGVIALLAGIVGADALFYLFAGAALAAAFLNAVFTYCVACNLFLRFRHISRHADLTERRPSPQDVSVG